MACHFSQCDRRINNCVGFANQKFFLLFILYGTLLSCYVVLTTLPVYQDAVNIKVGFTLSALAIYH